MENGPSPIDNEASPIDNGPSPIDNEASPIDNEASPIDNEASPIDNEASPIDNEANYETRPLLPENPESDERLLKIAAQVRNSKRARADVMRTTILNLCAGHFLTANQLAALLNRSMVDLRHRFITPMIEEGLLERRFPQQPSHERQAYRTREAAP
jgi:ATP-dependent DNA helicase RecG